MSADRPTQQKADETGVTETSEISIRPARCDDVPAIVNMLADDFLGRVREVMTDPVSDTYLQAFDEIAKDARNALMVAESADGAVIGCLQITFIPGLSYRGAQRALIEDVRVDAKHRGRRVGHRMMEWAIEEARRRRCCLIELFAHETRAAALRFYGDLGFEQHHRGLRLSLDPQMHVSRPPPIQ